jgi:hypothetical protein
LWLLTTLVANVDFDLVVAEQIWDTGDGVVMEKRYRDVGGYGGLGDRRFERYCAAFDRVKHCVESGYFLEAIALLDSLIWDRLSSRLGHLMGDPIDIDKNLGVVCSQLIGDTGAGGRERDVAFRDTVWQVKQWLVRRNDAVHATAKVFRADTSPEDFNAILTSHKTTVEDGMKYLREFDVLDTKSRGEVGKFPASYPDAFFPEKRGGGSRGGIWQRAAL